MQLSAPFDYAQGGPPSTSLRAGLQPVTPSYNNNPSREDNSLGRVAINKNIFYFCSPKFGREFLVC